MAGSAEQRQFDAGQELFREGDLGEEMFVIEAGSVQLSRYVDGTPTVLAELGEGDFAGEVALVCSRPHTVTATAVSATQCLAVSGELLESMVTQDSEIAVRFIRGLAGQLAATHELLSSLGSRDARTRVVLAIIRHAEGSMEHSADGVWVRRRLADIGDEVAISETELGEVSKLLLRNQLLKVRRDGILVPDVSRLYEFVRPVAG